MLTFIVLGYIPGTHVQVSYVLMIIGISFVVGILITSIITRSRASKARAEKLLSKLISI
jgi:uncharacterized membrane-anchored protein YhcB (DUF1043 family)